MSTNQERNPDSVTDKMWSRWHRSLDNRASMINIDSLEYCQSCMQPLALIETTQGSGPWNKPVTVTANLARLAGIPAYLVIFEADEEAFRSDMADAIGHDGVVGAATHYIVRRAWRRRVDDASPWLDGDAGITADELDQWILSIHDNHQCAPRQAV